MFSTARFKNPDFANSPLNPAEILGMTQDKFKVEIREHSNPHTQALKELAKAQRNLEKLHRRISKSKGRPLLGRARESSYLKKYEAMLEEIRQLQEKHKDTLNLEFNREIEIEVMGNLVTFLHAGQATRHSKFQNYNARTYADVMGKFLDKITAHAFNDLAESATAISFFQDTQRNLLRSLRDLNTSSNIDREKVKKAEPLEICASQSIGPIQDLFADISARANLIGNIANGLAPIDELGKYVSIPIVHSVMESILAEDPLTPSSPPNSRNVPATATKTKTFGPKTDDLARSIAR